MQIKKPDFASSRKNKWLHADYIISILLSTIPDDIKEFARQRCIELLKYINSKTHIPLIRDWEIDVFPIHGKMLIDAGVKKGPIIRNVMKYLFELWKKVRYSPFSFRFQC